MWNIKKTGKKQKKEKYGKKERDAGSSGNINSTSAARGGDEKRKKVNGKFGSIWNPINLQKEVHAFGYNFEWRMYALMLVGVLLLTVAVGIFFRLRVSYAAVILLVALLLLPFLITDVYKRMYEQKRFADVTDYMEQILYSFRKEGKVLSALRDCSDAIADGMMRQSVLDAIDYLEKGQIKTEKGLILEALALIEKHYACDRLHTVHEFLASAEERGGVVETSVDILIKDIEVWKRQVYELQKNKKVSQTDCILSIGAAVLLCGVDMYVMNGVKDMFYAGEDITVFQMMPVQISSLLLVLVCLFAFYKSSHKMTSNWLHAPEDDREVLKSYEYLTTYDGGKAWKISAVLSGVFVIAAICCYLWISKVGSLLLFLLAVFMLFQHRFSYAMSMKDVRAALYRAFPEWMFDMALLLQSNNVQVSISQSIEKAEPILRGELEELQRRVGENPADVRSYTLFCDKFDVPEVATCMKMLYSISESGAGDAAEQIKNLIAHMHKLQEKEAALLNENINFKMHSFCFYPVVGTGGKMLVDMTAGVLLIMNLFQISF